MDNREDRTRLGAKLVAGLEQFATVLDEESRALAADDAKTLLEIARRKQELAITVARVARAREAAAPLEDDPHAARIGEFAAACEQRNRDNGAYVQGALSGVRKALAMLAGSQDGETYDAGGGTHSGLRTSRSLARS